MRLDKLVGPMMKIFNKLKFDEEGKSKQKVQGADFIMQVYPSRENDFDLDNQLTSRVIPVFDMKRYNQLEENIRGINHFLNKTAYDIYTPMIDERKTNLVLQQSNDKRGKTEE